VKAAWAARPARERQAIAAIAFAVATVLLAAFVWLPLERQRARLAAEVPRLAASVATMERQAAEVARIRSLPATPAAATAAPAAAMATALGARLPGAQVTPLDDKRVRLAGSDVPYGAVLETLAAAQSGFGLRVDTARIEALPAAGRVRAELVLARP
jgi:general secretion pathway protein M